LLTVKKQVWSRLGALYVAALDYKCLGADTERV
jgi:hypothetical protein